MSPHGDLIAFGIGLAIVVAPVVAYWLLSRWHFQTMQMQHWQSVQRHNYRVWTALKELDHCDGSGGRS